MITFLFLASFSAFPVFFCTYLGWVALAPALALALSLSLALSLALAWHFRAVFLLRYAWNNVAALHPRLSSCPTRHPSLRQGLRNFSCFHAKCKSSPVMYTYTYTSTHISSHSIALPTCVLRRRSQRLRQGARARGRTKAGTDDDGHRHSTLAQLPGYPSTRLPHRCPTATLGIKCHFAFRDELANLTRKLFISSLLTAKEFSCTLPTQSSSLIP